MQETEEEYANPIRQWSEEEQERTIALIQHENPALWARYIENEKNSRRTDAEDLREMDRLVRLHLFPGMSTEDITVLFIRIHKRLRAELGLPADDPAQGGPRAWTDAEVDETIALIKREDPQLWERYINGEKKHNSVEMEDGDAMARLAYRHLFPHMHFMQVVRLMGAVRDKTRNHLQLEWPPVNLAGLRDFNQPKN